MQPSAIAPSAHAPHDEPPTASDAAGGRGEPGQILGRSLPGEALGTAQHELDDDRTLALQAANGDQGAFERIMRRYNQRLYRLSMAIMGEASEAEDVLQESYVRAYHALAGYAGKGSLGAWLARIVRNEAIDRLRARESRRSHILLEADLRRAAGKDEDMSPLFERQADADERSNPHTAVELAEAKHLLEAAITRLPESFRTAFMLREVEGMSVEETAEYLGIPAATVKTRDHRARLLLRTYLSASIDRTMPQAFAFLSRRCDELVARVLQRLRT